MATANGSGFNAEKFRKLVAMFDSPFSDEAATAFRLALAELKKDQLRFCDRLIDAMEATRAKEECAQVRAELKRAFDRCAKREAQAEELQAIIDRLHERIGQMEAEAAASDEAAGVESDEATAPNHGRSYVDFTEIQDDPEPDTPPYVSNEPQADDPIASASQGALAVQPVVLLPFLIAVCIGIWVSQFVVVNFGHVATADEWKSLLSDVRTWFWFAGLFALWLILSKAAVFLCEFRLRRSPRFVAWYIRKVGGFPAVLYGIVSVLAIWLLTYFVIMPWIVREWPP